MLTRTCSLCCDSFELMRNNDFAGVHFDHIHGEIQCYLSRSNPIEEMVNEMKKCRAICAKCHTQGSHGALSKRKQKLAHGQV